MPYKPEDVIYPKSHFRRVVRVLHDGTANTPEDFSIAEIELHDGERVYGIRHNVNYWNGKNPDIGYPTCRPGSPTWYLLPGSFEELIAELSMISEML